MKNFTDILQKQRAFPSYGRIYPEPYGVTLIMSTWNYPLKRL